MDVGPAVSSTRSWGPFLRRRAIMRVSLIAVIAALALSAVEAPTVGATKSPRDGLNALSCPSSTMCMAVGARGRGHLAELWNGTQWSVTKAPHGGFVSSVSCPTSTSACAASGRRIQVWNGTAWTRVGGPIGGGAFFSGFDDVSCIADGSCVAVGGVPGPGLNGYATSAIGSLGYPKRWVARTASPPVGLFGLVGVSCTSSTFCMGVGGQGNTATYAATWNGGSWSTVSIPTIPLTQSLLDSVSCTSPSQCTAVGYSGSTSHTALVETWNGTAWTIATTPSVVGIVSDVSCATPNSCMAVGTSDNNAAFAEGWNGTSWSLVPTASLPGATGSSLSGVSCPGPRTAWRSETRPLPGGS